MDKKRFDFIVGNPPYQEESNGSNANDTPVYHYFCDKTYTISDHVELIMPARFLFNAGGTPKEWNKKMLNDPHIKVVFFEQNSSAVFPNTRISGGVAILYRAEDKIYTPIEVFTPFPILNSIMHKVNTDPTFNFSTIVSNRGLYKFSDLAYAEHPEELKKTADRRIAPSSFERMPCLFTIDKPNDENNYVKLIGIVSGKRTYRWCRSDYICYVESLNKFKVFISKADGSGGQLGYPIPAKICGKPFVAPPGIGAVETFISIGSSNTEFEAQAIATYIQTKFARTMLGVLKVTQNCPKQVWRKVPIQNFTTKSDIDWTLSIPEIDQQLYRKYDLNQEEIEFIESHVKEMT